MQNRPQKDKILLGYWNMPFRGQIMRFLLEYVQLQYSENRYNLSEMEEWFQKDKVALGLPFPNLPYIIDGNNKVTETSAVASYIIERGGKPELHGKNEDRFQVDAIKSLASETIFTVNLYYRTPEKRDEYFDIIQTKLAQMLKFQGGKQWAVGYLTAADFFIYAASKQTNSILPERFQKRFGNQFNDIWKRFEAIPQIAAYMKSDRYIPY